LLAFNNSFKSSSEISISSTVSSTISFISSNSSFSISAFTSFTIFTFSFTYSSTGIPSISVLILQSIAYCAAAFLSYQINAENLPLSHIDLAFVFSWWSFAILTSVIFKLFTN
jgi:hypothetical protein